MFHLEIGGDAPRVQLEAAAAAIAVLLGTPATVTVSTADPAKLPPMPIATAVPMPPEPIEATYEHVPLPVAAPTLADQLIAGEEARVSALAVPLPPAGVEVDSRGLPHDLRIHSAEKSKKKDGEWRNKRGLDPALLATVEAELKATMAVPVPVAVPAPPAGDAPVVTDPAAAFGAVEVPPPPVAEAAPEPNAMAEFARVMRVVTAKTKAGLVDAALVASICAQLGIPSVKDFVKRPDLIPAFEALLP
jgi:hypothetical protein